MSIKNKEGVGKSELTAVLDLLDGLKIRYWIDGGWGVDILTGKQNREHRDVDVDFDAEHTALLLDALQKAGYEVTTDWRPSRIELCHPRLGWIDIHPLELLPDGSARQAAPEGGRYDFRAEWFTSVSFEGREIPCISAEAQKLFHTGYERRDTDRTDMENLDKFLRK